METRDALEFSWQLQQASCLSRLARPLKQISVLIEMREIAEPDCARVRTDLNDVRVIAWADATADGELKTF